MVLRFVQVGRVAKGYAAMQIVPILRGNEGHFGCPSHKYATHRVAILTSQGKEKEDIYSYSNWDSFSPPSYSNSMEVRHFRVLLCFFAVFAV